MVFSIRVLPMIGLLLFFAISCASSSQTKKDDSPPGISMKETESSRQIRLMNERILTTPHGFKRDAQRDYKIGPEDLLEISVFEEEKLNKTVRVSSQGNISLPLLGVLTVKGLTANQLEKEIAELLAEKYLQDPHISIFIREYRNQRISVMGAVEKPGVFDVTGQKTILDLLSMAGGLKEDAGPSLFLIRRPSEENEFSEREKKESAEKTSETYVISLDELLVKGDFRLNQPLNHGDVINIPVSGKIFVGGQVIRPGGFPMKGKKITVSQAIAMAEGLKLDASGSEAKIFREAGTEREILSVDIYAIQKGENKDPYLMENDILIVPRSGTKALFYGVLDTLKGVMGFGVSLGAI